MTPCGHCDNCTRAPETIDRKDVTAEAWKILRVAEHVKENKGRVTLAQLAELARGVGKGEFGTSKRASKSGSGKGTLDLQGLCGGPVVLSKEVSPTPIPCEYIPTSLFQHAETLTMQLYLDGYLQENVQQTPYSVIIYLRPRAKAVDLTRFSCDAVESGSGPRIVCNFSSKPKRANGKQRKLPAQSDSEAEPEPEAQPTRAKSTRKRKAPPTRGAKASPELIDSSNEDFTEQLQNIDSDAWDSDEDEGDGGEDAWVSTLRSEPHASKRARTNGGESSKRPPNSRRARKDAEIIELYSD